jgi:cytochrome c peroxidase
MRVSTVMAVAVLMCAGAVGSRWPGAWPGSVRVIQAQGNHLDDQLAIALQAVGFTGAVEASVEQRLGRPVDPRLTDLGRLLFFDEVLGLHFNSCAGCHGPAFGFGDSQSIAIGVQANGVVGPDRMGPRNQRKSPIVINSAFFPRLMLNGRFAANSGDPFDNSAGFAFPAPEEDALKFGAADPRFPTLLSAQGIMPSTELVEMAGFTGASTSPFFRDSPEFHQFDDGLGSSLPNDTNHTGFADPGFLNEEIRFIVLQRLQRIDHYVLGFADVFNQGLTAGFQIKDWMVGQALAEFQTSLTFANAPIDQFARGMRTAMSTPQKRGALLFFGKANCVECHAVGGPSSEMFSDFSNHVLGVPQVAPAGFGVGLGNVVFDGPGEDEDFGAEQFTGMEADRYKFRSSPLRNVAVQPAFFHNGAFTRLDDAIRHHLDVRQSLLNYSAANAGLDPDLSIRRGPDVPLALLDPLVRQPIRLTSREFDDLLAFVRDGLLDPRARPENLCGLAPTTVPSGFPVATFQGC